MNPAYDSYNYPHVFPYIEYDSPLDCVKKWYFIWDNIKFGPYSSPQEAYENFYSLRDSGEANSCSEEYRDEA